jgi:hypothetical protein
LRDLADQGATHAARGAGNNKLQFRHDAPCWKD